MSNKHAVKEAPASYQSTPVILGSLDAQSRHSREGGNPLAITENLNLWISATKAKSTSGRGSNKKIELVGIKKLRELILELAVRGKLVPQNPEDEPASELLKKIDAEKAKLIAEGKIKKQKKLPEISEDEKPFELPQGWEWIRLGNALEVINGRAYKKHEMLESGTPLLRVGNLFTSNEWYYSDLELDPNKYIDNGDLIYAWSASFGPFIWDGSKVIYHYHIWKLEIFDEASLYKPFAYHYLKAITEQIKASGSGIAMLHMTKERMEKLVIPIPPLAEQQRIVAKVDELMALCDQLEQQSEHQLNAHKQLVETLLATLIESENADDLATNWQRLAEHFDTLFSGALTSTAGIGNGGGEWAIDRLKDTILQLAVMGKLVPQNPDDEPASELLKKIDAEKAKLVKEGKIKKQKPLPAITDEEKPFELPDGWECIRFGDATFNRDAERVPLSVSVRENRRGEYDYYGASGVIDNINDFLFDKPLLLIGEDGANLINRSTPIAFIARGKYWVNNHAHVIDGISEQFLIYISMYINSISLESYVTGTAQPKMNQAKMNSIVLIIPPLKEQQRIISKVDELFALCDQLKARLQAASETQLTLTEALVEQALN
ncbi:restriction endonuclease subunit S [Thalassolituus oleivorans]|uniref:restriction endonuclease subunit S n=1 Tax=Thalassolituus oleivorans TaxID=187493 RepID=UPI0023F16C34|nr:restriction endonuclease subunit S [Thalassolituus oleivorans]